MPKSRSHRARKSHKRSHTRKMKRGGYLAPVNETNTMSMRDSLAQGSQYLNIHSKQHGGVAPYPTSLGSTIPTNMIASARTGPLDSALQQIQGMQDGGKRKHSRKNKHSRKHKHSRKCSHKRSYKHRGGVFVGSPVSANAMLLPPGLERQAALNYEWSMAKDPSAFLPNP